MAVNQRKKLIKTYYVYILECANGSLYTGITNDLERRIAAHNSQKGARYTRAFGPVKLIWKEKKRSRSKALIREAEIKRWSRAKKLLLISQK